MAGSFAAAAGTMLTLNLGLMGLFVIGSGLSVPAATTIGPASECAAQFSVYVKVGYLQTWLVGLLAMSTLVCGGVKAELAGVEGEQLALMGERRRRLVRAALLLVLATSAATVAMGLATYVYVFQIKVAVFACVSAGAKVSFIICYGVVGLFCACFYARMAWIAVVAN